MEIISAVKNYIEYLEKNHGLCISLHPMEPEPVILFSELFTFNIHRIPYCVFVKSFEPFKKKCLECQRKAYHKVMSGAFCGECFAGVYEFVYPIRCVSRVIGFISVSGYRGGGRYKALAAAEKFPSGGEALLGAYEKLKAGLPDRSFLDTVIAPLRLMLELAYLEAGEGETGDLDKRLLAYLRENHNGNISIDDICRHFGYSRSYISHRFSEKNGMGIKEYIIRLKIEDAKALLVNSQLNITEVAGAVGCADSNRFSQLFKSRTGISPRKYRRAAVEKNRRFNSMMSARKK